VNGSFLDRQTNERSAAPPATEDVQGRPDLRRIAIDRVGIKALRQPIVLEDRDELTQSTIAELRMYVGLAHDRKGTHMSRFLEVLQESEQPLSVARFGDLLERVAERLDADKALLEIEFPYFRLKRAPVSGQASVMDYRATLIGSCDRGTRRQATRVSVPATNSSLSSREASRYGAPTQRVHVSLTVERDPPAWIEDLIESAERRVASELFGVLKRSDEKLVTELAYDNAKLIEDLAREIAFDLRRDPRGGSHRVEVETVESVHNHRCYVAVESPDFRPL
jgi:GTP cyclohydrolase I